MVYAHRGATRSRAHIGTHTAAFLITFVPLALSFVSGCMPSYRFEARPLPPPPRNAAERCFQKERIEVASGNARWSYTEGSSSAYGTGYVTHNLSAGGLTFFRAGERLKPIELLELLGDDELTKIYKDKLAETSGAHTAYPIWRNTSLLMAGGGLALSGVALGQVLSWSQEERANKSIPVTLWVGAGLAVASILPAALAGTTYENAIVHDRATQLFDERTLLPRLDASLRVFNLRAAERCGFQLDNDPAPPRPPPR